MNNRFNNTIFKRYLFYLAGPILLIGLMLMVLGNSYARTFDETLFDESNVFNHIDELTSPRYAGRLAGSEGNRLALSYIERSFTQVGLEPAGDRDTYYQDLTTMIPTYKSQPYIRVKDPSGNLLKEFYFGKDFIELMDNYGSSGHFQGQLLFLAKDIFAYLPHELKDKVIVKAGLMDKDIDYAVDCGVKGILMVNKNPTGNLARNAVPIKSKKGKAVPIQALTWPSFENLATYAHQNLQVEISQESPYEQVFTPNILGKITGSNENAGYVIISAHIDHVGSAFEGGYFPGTLDGASGVGMMLELARVMKQQAILPEQTIIFAAWNGQEYGQSGSSYYTDHPLYPLANTQVLVLNMLGDNSNLGLILDTSDPLGRIYSGKLAQYLSNSGLTVQESLSGEGDDHAPFVEKGIPAVLVKGNLLSNYSQRQYVLHTFGDSMENISKENLQSSGVGLLSYIKAVIYQDTFPRYLRFSEASILILYLFGLAWIYGVYQLHKLSPHLRVFRTSIENIYYSTLHSLFAKLFFYLTPALLIFFSLVFISNIPTNFNLVYANETTHSNFSLYLVVKKSVFYIRALFDEGMGLSKYHTQVMDILPVALFRTLWLLSGALTLAFILGTLKGIGDGFRSRGKGRLRSLGTLFALSLPDVFIVICVQLGMIFLNENNLLLGLNNYEEGKRYLVALLCLSIIPTVYISRITSTAMQEEIRRDYIRAAKAKGLGNFQLIKNHLTRPVLIKVIDTLGPVLTLVISNLIIIEYMTHYPGLVYSLIRFYQQNDTISFIGFALALGLIYVIFSLLFKLAARLINPLRGRSKL